MIRFIKIIRSLIFSLIAKISQKNIKANIKANGYTKLSKNTKTGVNVNFNGMIIYGIGHVFIGDNFHSGFGCKIITSYHNYNGEAVPYDNTNIVKDVIIEDNVWLGINVLILSGVIIGEGAIIQAGSVVVNDIPKFAIAGGHPAKVFSYRDEVKYKELKKQGKFF